MNSKQAFVRNLRLMMDPAYTPPSKNDMPKLLNKTEVTDTITLSHCTDGWWLWDDTRGMNLSMHAPSPQQAFIETIGYYQRRLTQVEDELKTLKIQVEAFVQAVHKCPDEDG